MVQVSYVSEETASSMRFVLYPMSAGVDKSSSSLLEQDYHSQIRNSQNRIQWNAWRNRRLPSLSLSCIKVLGSKIKFTFFKEISFMWEYILFHEWLFANGFRKFAGVCELLRSTSFLLYDNLIWSLLAVQVLNGLLGRHDAARASTIPIGIIPAGSDNSLVWTILGVKDPTSAALAIVKVFSLSWITS